MIDQMIRYLEETQQALLVAARDLRALADAGLCKCPADILLDDALAVLRANCEIGQLQLSIAWQDRFSAPEIRWHLSAPPHTLDATTLSALLRVFGLQHIQPDTVERLNVILSPTAKEPGHADE